MSFEPVTMYQLRCDGDTTKGQCWHVLMVDEDYEDPGDDKVPAVSFNQELKGWKAALRYYGWLVTQDDRILCPEHIASLEYTARAAVDGLPFDDLLASATPEES